MDCPHCHEENLVGAKLCASCGRNMRSAPPPESSPSPTATQIPRGPATIDRMQRPMPTPPAPPPPPERPAADGAPDANSPVQAYCRVCMEGYERAADETGIPLCPGCRQFAPVPGGDAGKNDVLLHPATQDQPGVDPRAGTAIPRMKPVKRRASLRTGPVVAVAGLLIGLVGMGVVTFAGREKDPAAAYLGDAKREAASFVVAPSRTDVVRLEAALTLSIVREMPRANFANQFDKVLNLRQQSAQSAEIAWVRDDPRGVVLDSASECRLVQQTGTVGGSDGRDAPVYPWSGHRATARLVVPPDPPTQILGGTPAIVGRDMVPCLTLRDIAAPPGSVAPDTVWRAPVVLPFAATRDGVLRSVAFPCELTYDGRLTRNGLSLLLFGVRGSAPARPTDLLEDMNRSEATIRGALLFDAATGLIAEAHLTSDVSVWLDRGRVEDHVHVTGTLDVKRR